MGDRIAITFVNGRETSPTLFNHWGGRRFLATTQKYIKQAIPRRIGDDKSSPLSRREPRTVMVDYISYLTKGKVIDSSLYLGKNTGEGDSSDNGHWYVNTVTGHASQRLSEVV